MAHDIRDNLKILGERLRNLGLNEAADIIEAAIVEITTLKDRIAKLTINDE